MDETKDLDVMLLFDVGDVGDEMDETIKDLGVPSFVFVQVSTEQFGATASRFVSQTGEDGEDGARLAMLGPLEQLKTVGVGHREIENDDVGIRVMFAVVELAFTFEIADGALGVLHATDNVQASDAAQAPLKEEGIIVRILNEQNRFGGFGI